MYALSFKICKNVVLFWLGLHVIDCRAISRRALVKTGIIVEQPPGNDTDSGSLSMTRGNPACLMAKVSPENVKSPLVFAS